MSDKDSIAELAKTVIPNSNRVIIRIEEKEKETKSGIKFSQTERGQDETLVGTILAVGDGHMSEAGTWIPTKSKVGQRVLIDRMSGINIRIDKNGKIYPFSQDITEDVLPIRIAREESILWYFPLNWSSN